MEKQVRVLVIDDEEVIHAGIARILSRFGYNVKGALTAQEGLDMMMTETFDVVITDLMMAEMNGLEMLAEMRSQKINIPTLMITGYPTIKTAIEALRLGALDYLPKPFTRQELLSPLQRALRRPSDVDMKNAEPRTAPQTPGEAALTPGDHYRLPGHSWGRYNMDGTFDIGIEASFLSSVPAVESITVPKINEIIEQGYAGFEISAAGETHSVFMPFSGRIVEVFQVSPGDATADTALVKIIPSNAENETGVLEKR